ncbi:MAG: hypothetical protein PHX44_08445 [Sulfurimonas sp.]|uniref:hypothetical protein n=1 Tax=Sulfurimonas sp. TaxID=2022749 RepID=UPI002606E881|nr:hypothetical protein [Sulfurimonas sp.]MDD2653062.1 hypothetical protein [Sulfurimonas sp.]MDD3452245.1 hypothetical protein [Sulfurimonas sp.]
MSLITILLIGAILSVAFHFLGVYTGAKKIVWIMLVIVWAASFGLAVSEIKPKGYAEIEKMKGKFAETDKLIEEAMPEVTIYEMVVIKKSYNENKPKQ